MRQLLIIYHWDYQGADYAFVPIRNNESLPRVVSAWAAEEAVHCNDYKYDLTIDHVLELDPMPSVMRVPIETWQQIKESA